MNRVVEASARDIGQDEHEIHIEAQAEKLGADEVGDEQEVPLEVVIEVGALDRAGNVIVRARREASDNRLSAEMFAHTSKMFAHTSMQAPLCVAMRKPRRR